MKKIFFAFLFAGILGANDELAPHFDETKQEAMYFKTLADMNICADLGDEK